MTAPDVVVVGAGAIGAACAYELARAGLRVTVIDRAQPGAEASGASAGMLSVFSVERATPFGELGRLSRDLYGPLAEVLRAESGIDIGHERSGHIFLCMSDDEVDWARTVFLKHGSGAERVEFVSAEDLRRLEPEVTPDARAALFTPRNEWVNNTHLVAALVQAARHRGVRFELEQPVEALLLDDGRVTGVRGRTLGAIHAKAVVLAAGAWSGEIVGVPPTLRLRPVKGQMLAVEHTPRVIHHVVLRDEIYLVPRVSGECLVGATVEDGVADKTVTPGGLRWLLTEALVTVPRLAGLPFRRAWAGLRPASPDGLPAIGPWPGLPGLFIAAGHFRNGILLTPVTARIIRDWIVDGSSSVPAASHFLPDRLLR